MEECVLSLDLNTDSGSALIIVSGSEFQTVGTEWHQCNYSSSSWVRGRWPFVGALSWYL